MNTTAAAAVVSNRSHISPRRASVCWLDQRYFDEHPTAIDVGDGEDVSDAMEDELFFLTGSGEAFYPSKLNEIAHILDDEQALHIY